VSFWTSREDSLDLLHTTVTKYLHTF